MREGYVWRSDPGFSPILVLNEAELVQPRRCCLELQNQVQMAQMGWSEAQRCDAAEGRLWARTNSCSRIGQD